jgi:ABC-type Fe3+ transport system permease subunit
MNENDVGKKLVAGEDPIDFQMLTHRVLKRDRRRMWFLGVACVAAWMLVVILPWITILPMVARIVENQQGINSNTSISPEQREQTMLLLQVVKKGTIGTFVGSVVSMFVAAVCTVSLVILSRRATLRQTNDRLVQISAQLKALSER